MFGKLQVVTFKRRNVAFNRNWTALVISNHKLRTEGHTEKEVLEKLKILVLSYLGLNFNYDDVSDISFHEMTFDEVGISSMMKD